MPKPKPDKRIIFTAPEGMDIADKEPGDTIEAVAEFSIEPSGKLCLAKINGIELEGYEPKDDENAEGDAPSMGDAVMARTKQAGY